MKLYRVDMFVYAIAENETDAVAAALDFDTEVADGDCKATEATSVPDDWKLVIPWGAKEDVTCAEFIEDKDK